MSLFGDLDINDVNDDPFYTPPNTYHAVLTDAKLWKKDGDDYTRLVLTWQIDEPDSEYHKNQIQEYFTLFLYETGRRFTDLDANEVKATKFLLRRLRRGLDLSESEKETFATEGDTSVLIGRDAYITVVENPSKDDPSRKYTNIRDAVCARLYEEEKAVTSAANSSLGL